MSNELTGRQWQERIQSRRTGTDVVHVQNLLRERRMGGVAKPANTDFRRYLAMRRQMAGPDGKSRSKGHGPQPKGKNQNSAMRGRSFLRPTQLTDATRSKIAAANQNKKPDAPAKNKPLPNPRLERAAKAYEAAKGRVREIANRTQTAIKAFKPGKRPQRFPEPGNEQLAKRHLKAQKTGGPAKTQQKTQTKPKAPTPPPPTRRR